MPYEIGRVFSPEVLSAFARARESQTGPASFHRGATPGRDAPDAGSLRAAEIRAATSDADRASRERIASMMEGGRGTRLDATESGRNSRAAASEEGKSVRAENRNELTGKDLKRRAERDRRILALKEVGQRADVALRAVKTAQDGAKLIAQMTKWAREKDAYGRTDPDLVAQMSQLIEQARAQLTTPVEKGGFGLPADVINRAAMREQADLSEGMGPEGVSGPAPDAGGTPISGGAPIHPTAPSAMLPSSMMGNAQPPSGSLLYGGGDSAGVPVGAPPQAPAGPDMAEPDWTQLERPPGVPR